MAHLVRTLRPLAKSLTSSVNLLGKTNNVSKSIPLCSASVQTRLMSSASDYEMIKVSQGGENNKIGIVTLHRPKALNALCNQLMKEMVDAMSKMEADNDISVIIMTGSEKAFAAGADIKEMQDKGFSDVFGGGFLNEWEKIANVKKPVISAVNGYALGGGCEIAMMGDILIAGEKAKFGQPEITIGTIPGAGGTQRLTKAIGKSRAMLMNLTGEPITAQQALEWGLVASVHPPEKLMDAAIEIGNKIARHSPLTIKVVKEAVLSSFELSLQEGILREKRLFHATFATADRKEGMTAFVEKRKPNFTGK